MKSIFYKKVTFLHLYVFLFLLVSCAAPTIYVATNGDDQNSGTKSHPVATLNKAVELSRLNKIKQIIIGEGRYYDVSVALTAKDSGLFISGTPGKEVCLFEVKAIEIEGENYELEKDWYRCKKLL